MNIVKHAENIYEIENFLTTEEQELFLSSCTDDNWKQLHPGNIIKRLTIEQERVADKIRIELSKFFKNMDSFAHANYLRRLITDEFMHPHTDGGDPDNPKVIIFGIAIYLNDEFSGGELYYSDLDLIVVPKPRSVVIHDAKLNHEVKPVKSGKRYSITEFVFGNDLTELDKNLLDIPS